MPVVVRPAVEADLPALARIDLTYATDRVLALDRAGDPPQHTFTFRWRSRRPETAVAYEYDEEKLRDALSRAHLFLIAELDGEPVGLIIVLVPPWTDAGEITDLAVHRPYRRRGAGRVLVDAALQFARSRGLRALWVVPRSDNAEAIEFYRSLGFRLSGFNDRMYSNRDYEDGRVTLFMYREMP
jgi:ribosomal protein S18 acetylase RimI-like enzyme